jgi:hypothetical protein
MPQSVVIPRIRNRLSSARRLERNSRDGRTYRRRRHVVVRERTNAAATVWWGVVVEWRGRLVVMSRPSDDVFDVAGTAVPASPGGVGVDKEEEE